MGALQSIESRDGTVIRFEVVGHGPPLVLVHGSVADRTRWAPVVAGLAERFTVHLVDRRGHGNSPDGHGAYDIGREGEDIAAVVSSLGKGVYLFGHSYGALCSLEAALRTNAIERMALYEPPLSTPGYQVASADSIARIRERIAAGDPEGALLLFYREVLLMPEKDITAMRPTAIWQARIKVAHTIARELEVVNAFDVSARLSKIDIPVRLFLGTAGAPYFRPAAERISKQLPRADLVLLEGQDHIMMDRDPAGFVAKVQEFAAAK